MKATSMTAAEMTIGRMSETLVGSLTVVAKSCRILEMEGHGDLSLGHLSLRDPEGRGFWMKRNRIGLGEVLGPEDLVLIDMGAEFNYYTGDITRTYPVNGKFTAVQKEFYERVLKVQKHLISMIHPGVVFKSLQDTTIEMLTEHMLELGLLKGSVQQNIEQLNYKKYYPHGVSHWLGMDVHDAGLYKKDGPSRPLEAGMCFTIEPGLYVPADDMSAPAHLRGLGVRIEDNILVTDTGHENLTQSCPKEVKDLENLIGT